MPYFGHSAAHEGSSEFEELLTVTCSGPVITFYWNAINTGI